MIGKLLFNLVKFILIYILCTFIIIAVFIFINPAVTPFMQEKDSESMMNLFIPNSIEHNWRSSNNISTYAKLAVIASEDQLFKDHFGFDFEQIQKAWRDKERGRRVRGASTISMQVAKNLFLFKSKDFVRKGFEAYYTLVIELLWTKSRILEVYLNVAQFGDNIFGVGTASKIFFNRESSNLKLVQAATLAAVLPNPARFSASRPSCYIRFRRANIIRQMYQIGWKKYLEQM